MFTSRSSLTRPGQVAAIFDDITKSRVAEEEIRKSNTRYRELFDSVIEGIAFVDSEEIVRMCNPAFARIYDLDRPEDLLGRSVLEFVPEEQKRLIREQTAVRRRNESSTYELDIVTARGKAKILQVSASPRIDPNGNFLGTFGAVMDITERQKAEQALLVSEQKFRGLFESLRDGVGRVTLEGYFLDANPVLLEMLGYDMEELKGLTIWDVTPEKWHSLQKDILKEQLLTRGYSDIYERELRRRTASPFPSRPSPGLPTPTAARSGPGNFQGHHEQEKSGRSSSGIGK